MLHFPRSELIPTYFLSLQTALRLIWVARFRATGGDYGSRKTSEYT
jgi:hypothetical protein